MPLLDPALLQAPGFRPLAAAVLLNAVAMVGEQVLVGWVTLELTNSPFAVGVALGARMAPLLLVGLPAGVVADRLDRRRLLAVTNAGMAGATGLVGVLLLLDALDLGLLLGLTFLAGCLRALNVTARQSHAHDVAGPAALVDALALLELCSRAGGLAGSLATGSLTARLGAGVAYLVVAASYLASSVVLGPGGSRAARPAVAAPDSGRQSLARFFGGARRDQALLPLLALTAAGEVLGFSHQTVLPSLARDVYAVGSEGLGVMTAARLVGGILGIALVSRLGQAHGRGPLLFVGLVVFGGSLVGLAFAHRFAWVLVILVVANAAGALSDLLSQTLIQLSVPADLRGRAGGAWVFAIGTAPLGQLQIGALASLVGVSAAVGLSGLALVLVALAGALRVPRLRRL